MQEVVAKQLDVDGKPKQLLVFLHGVGSDGLDMIALAPFLQYHLPECHFFAPNGVERYDMASFGYQWFSLADRLFESISRCIEVNMPKIRQLIQVKQEQLGVSNKDTILFGFSQGSMVGIHLTLAAQEPYKAMLAFSGRRVVPSEVVNTKTPVCIVHGRDDEIIDYNEGNNLASYLNKHHIANKLLIIENLQHSIDHQGIEFAIQFLNNLNSD